MSSATTVTRRIVQTWWLDLWHGAGGAEKNYNASAVFGVSFDPDKDADCSPFTATEVRETFGFTRLKMEEIDQWQDRVAGGFQNIGGTPRRIKHLYRLWRFQFAIRTPRNSDLALGESYAKAIVDRFAGLHVEHDEPGDDWVRLRHRAKWPPRLRGPIDDDPWQIHFQDIRLETRERHILQLDQEVDIS